MEDRDLFKAIEKLAKEARKSGRAKSRKSHMFVGSMLFIILAAMANDEEADFYYKVQYAYGELEEARRLRELQETNQ
jgi:hypothetical protein